MRLRWVRLLALLLSLSLVAAACDDDDNGGDDGDATTTSQEEGAAPADRGNVDGTLVLGSVLPSTGDLGVLGEPMNQAVAMAIRDINAAGGALGGDVELVAEDSATDENVANQAVDKLLGPDQVDAIIGPASSRVSLSVIDKITGARTVQCSPSNTGVDFTTYEDDGYYFRTAPPDNLQGRVLAEMIADDGHASVSIMHLADAYGQGFADSLAESLEEVGVTVDEQVGYDPQGTNFDADVARLVEAGSEANALIAFPDTGATIIQTMVEEGIGPQDVQLYLTDGTQSGSLGASVDPDNPTVVAGSKGTAPSAAPPGGAEFFPAAFAEFAPGVDTIFSAHAYDCTIVIALAAIAADSDDSTAIRDEMNAITTAEEGDVECSTFAECKEALEAGDGIDYQGAAGPLDFAEAGEPSRGEYDRWEFGDETTEGDDGAVSVAIDVIDTVVVSEEGVEGAAE
ncbi:MAG TPA: ABC transporter substrate-binding protein [Acidimicrobiia bacterium]|nr:ABC transporter substrate-binding protein [Acidimicrobiia bacterium]